MRNPWGRRGSPKHQERVLEAEQRLIQRSWQTVSGGHLPERKFENRFPDLVMRKGDGQIAIQVGKVTKGGKPVARERRAIRALRATGEFDHVFFLQY